MFCPRSWRMASIARSFSGRSSTIRMLTFSSVAIQALVVIHQFRSRLPNQPGTWEYGVLSTEYSERCNLTRLPVAVLPSPMQPAAKDGKHLLGVHRLGQVIPGAGLDALLAVTLHGLGRNG